MNVCASNPQYISQADVDQEYVAKEKAILLAEAKEENPNKPEQIIERMVQGRLSKELKEICLLDEPFIMDQNITVEQYLKNNNATVVSYSRNVVGEGVEKKANNFVDEVMSQMK